MHRDSFLAAPEDLVEEMERAARQAARNQEQHSKIIEDMERERTA